MIIFIHSFCVFLIICCIDSGRSSISLPFAERAIFKSFFVHSQNRKCIFIILSGDLIGVSFHIIFGFISPARDNRVISGLSVICLTCFAITRRVVVKITRFSGIPFADFHLNIPRRLNHSKTHLG